MAAKPAVYGDATSGLLAGEGHIPLACAPSPTSAAPITGLVGASEVEFAHEMTVSRIYESPRVTKPFTDAAWAKVDALGQEIEAKLVAGDVRLTMGGEPTFVSIDDPDGAEWNTAALGPDKRRLSAELFQRMRQLAVHGTGQGVFLVGAIELQGQQPALAVLQDGIGHGESRGCRIQRSTTGQEHIGQQLIARQARQEQTLGKRLDTGRVPAE